MPYRYPHLTAWSLYKPVINIGQLYQTIGPCVNAIPDAPCIICHEAIQAGQSTLTHSSCSQPAHENCINPWLQRQYANSRIGKCPLCQQGYSFYEALYRIKTAAAAEQQAAVKKLLRDAKQQMLFVGDAAVLDADSMLVLDEMATKFLATEGMFAQSIYATFSRKNEMVQTDAEDELECGKPWRDVRSRMRTGMKSVLDHVDTDTAPQPDKLHHAIENFKKGPQPILVPGVGLEKPTQLPPPVDQGNQRMVAFINEILKMNQDAASNFHKVYNSRRTAQLLNERHKYYERTGILFPHELTRVYRLSATNERRR